MITKYWCVFLPGVTLAIGLPAALVGGAKMTADDGSEGGGVVDVVLELLAGVLLVLELVLLSYLMLTIRIIYLV